MKDGLSFHNEVHYKHFSPEGNLKYEYTAYNNTQNQALLEVIDGLDAGSCNNIITMAIGTGTGQGAATSALASLSSYETGAACVGTQGTSVVNGDKVTNVATFTAGGSWAIEECGLFTSADGASGMLFYEDSISTNMTSGDTLQISWAVSVA